MLDYLFFAVPSPRLILQAASALVFTSQRAAKRAAAGVPQGSVAWEEAQPWVQESCSLGEQALLPQPNSLALKWPLPGWGASTWLSQRAFPLRQWGRPRPRRSGSTLPVISILHPIPATAFKHKKGIATRCECKESRGSSPLHRCYFAQTIESVRRTKLERRII